MARSGHPWSPTDDLVALYLYLHGDTYLPRKLSDISSRLGMTESSLKMRIGNYKALHARTLGTSGGLGNFAQQSRDVYQRYHSTPEPALRQLVIAAII